MQMVETAFKCSEKEVKRKTEGEWWALSLHLTFTLSDPPCLPLGFAGMRVRGSKTRKLQSALEDTQVTGTHPRTVCYPYAERMNVHTHTCSGEQPCL